MESEMLVMQGALLFATTGSSLMMNGAVGKELKIDILADRIKEYIKDKEEVRLSDLVGEFNESADIIIMAVNKLKEKGIIEEV